LWSAEIKPPSPCVSLWFLYWCKTWYLRTFYRVVTVVTDLPAGDAICRPMFCITVIIMLSGPCFALQLSSSCFQAHVLHYSCHHPAFSGTRRLRWIVCLSHLFSGIMELRWSFINRSHSYCPEVREKSVVHSFRRTSRPWNVLFA